MSRLRRIFDRRRAGEDIGLDRAGLAGRQRTINADGSYNLVRKTGRLFGNFYPYHWIITCTWTQYWLLIFGFYGIMNALFAITYYLIGPEQLGGMQSGAGLTHFMYCFFFSAQSFTTVGYGGIYPVGKLANFTATIEAFVGLMTFALATGTLYGRFSKPVSRIKYSKNILIAPYGDTTGMQFMVSNELNSILMEMEAKVNISWMQDDGTGKLERQFQQVKLQLDKISLFPLSWIINHPIDEESALYGRTVEEIKKMDMEVIILLKGYDDVFAQNIYSRQSYVAAQFVYGAKFKKPFYVNPKGKLLMDLTMVGQYDLVELPVPEAVA